MNLVSFLQNEQITKRKKVFKDIDIRDVLQYFIAKSWIIVIVVAVCLVAAILYTAFIVPTYQSTSSMLIITDEGTTTQDFSAGQQIINNTPAVITGNVFCDKVAKMLLSTEEAESLLSATGREGIRSEGQREIIRFLSLDIII